jgi:hypothetical protein
MIAVWFVQRGADWFMLRGEGYAFWSGIGLVVFWPLLYAIRHNCHVRRCPRLTWHISDAHNGHPVCRHHHPDSRHPSLEHDA